MSGFVKLDTGILRSTLWMDRPAREVFITALLMAEPREFTGEVPQLEVRTLNLTGWFAPAGWYGFVEAAGVGIVREAGIDAEEGLQALERLGSPEGDSRSREFDGRRLIRIDGGYLVLNYMRYRERDYTAAERMQRYRDRKKAQQNGGDGPGVTRNARNVTRNVTQAEAEAEAEAESDPEHPSDALVLSPPGTGKPGHEGAPFHRQVLAAYHELLPELPRVKAWPKKRAQALNARITERLKDGKPADSVDYWREFFQHVAASDFLCGRAGEFRADLEWLLRPENFLKTIEGRYENRGRLNGAHRGR